MGYYIDLSEIKVEDYSKILKSADLLPSRRILKENLESNFELLKQNGVRNLESLLKQLKTKSTIEDFAKESGIEENFLTVLVREVKSYKQKPNKLRDFPETPAVVIKKLEDRGVKNTWKLYDLVLTSDQRIQLSKDLKIDPKEIHRLARLTDLSRVRWVNHTFAYVLYEAGYQTAKELAKANYENLYEEVKQLNKERAIYKGNIGLHDMKLCVEAAKDLPFEIEV